MEEAINKGAFVCACACACALVCACLRVVYQASRPSLCTLGGMQPNILEMFASSGDLVGPQDCSRRQGYVDSLVYVNTVLLSGDAGT